jgi:hypothetical protein
VAIKPQRLGSHIPPRQRGSIPQQIVREPTAEQRETALRIAETHRRICVPEAVCKHCLRAWPCAAFRWAEQVSLRIAELREGRLRERR